MNSTSTVPARRGLGWAVIAAATAVLLFTAHVPTPTSAAPAPASTVVPSPNQNSNDNVLFGVDGSGLGSTVWAAGYALNEPRGGGTRSMLMRFDGSAWSLVEHPRPGSINRLLDVDAITASDAWAVGNSNAAAGQPGTTLTLRWNGSAWNTVPSPNAAGSNSLNAVEAASTTDVWAVGSHHPSQFSAMPLVMRWNGQSWRTVPTPDSVQGFALNAVDATSSTNAWAVGTKIASPIVGGYSATAIRWNGTGWQEVPIPNPANLTLNGVAALGPNDVWAVGARIGAPNAVPVTLHWNGSAWTQVDTPVRSPDGGELSDVVAVSPSTLHAVGSAISNGVERILLLQWNGSTWTEVPTPTGGSEPRLRGVAAVGDRTAWTVGSQRVGPRLDPGPQRTLTIRATT